MINKDYSIGTDDDKYQSILDYALSKKDFSISRDIYLFPSNLNLSKRKTVQYNNKVLNITAGIKSNSNKDKADFFIKIYL